MTERNDLLAAIAVIIADYRQGDLATPTPAHVEQWVDQFDTDMRLPILREMEHVLRATYFSRKETTTFLSSVLDAKALVGSDPCGFWRSVKFLDIQGGGNSQKDMLDLFGALLQAKCGVNIGDCGADANNFVYLDDAIFSGGRISQDLVPWITGEAPQKATVHVVVMATHQSAYYNKDKVAKAIRASGKSIELRWWQAIELEDRNKYLDTSDVLRPVFIPVDLEVVAYAAALKYQPILRNSGQVGSLGIYSSDAGRQVLEQEFLKAGVRIRGMCPNLNQYQRPLGNMVLQGLGFGSLIVTFRNCPNNAPLALWAGNPWYPLFPRTTNRASSIDRFIASFAQDV